MFGCTISTTLLSALYESDATQRHHRTMMSYLQMKSRHAVHIGIAFCSLIMYVHV